MNSRFKKGSGCYVCSSCGKKTRATGGNDNEHIGLCVDCFDLAGIDNHLTDEGAESMGTNYGDDAGRILARRPELVKEFPKVHAALTGGAS